MIELLDYLRANGFMTFIVSGGGIPPWQVVGSAGKTEFRMWDASPTLVKLPDLLFFDDGPGKAEGITMSAASRFLLSATRSATRRCWSGPRTAKACASWDWCTRMMPSGSTPTDSILSWAGFPSN